MKRLGILSSTIMGLLAATTGGAFSHHQPAPRSGPKQEGGAGAKRAKARLAAKLKANKAIPDKPIYTRQAKRAAERSAVKRVRQVKKQQAMQQKLPGGSAAIA